MKKTNKTFKRFAAITSASLLAACAMAPVFTSMTSYAVDVTVGAATDSNRTFVAYKVLNATVSTDNKTITYSVVPSYASALKEALKLDAEATDAQIISAIEALKGKDDDMRAFADALYDEVKGGTADVTDITGGTAKDMTTGYYLIVDVSTGLSDDVRSKVMVDTADNREGGLKVNLKKDGPKFEKKIWDTDDSTKDAVAANTTLKEYEDLGEGFGDSADHDIGDIVPFKLTAKLPSEINLYDNYKLIFNDTLDAGLTLNKESFEVYINDVNVTTSFTVPKSSSSTFSVSNDNIKAITGVTYDGIDDIVEVYYTATLNSDAVIGNKGNWNGANLTYTNDYYWDGSEDSTNNSTSETPMDYVVAFTYQTVIDKIDSDGNALAGATFALSKKLPNGSWSDIGTRKGSTQFVFKGLDAGVYKLEETVVPDGYTKAADIEFTITAEHGKDFTSKLTDGKALTKFEVTEGVGLTASISDGKVNKTKKVDGVAEQHDAVSGEIYGEIVNNSGTLLPGTGGIGTTIFYLGGGAMAAIGGVYLISKRRMKKSEE